MEQFFMAMDGIRTPDRQPNRSTSFVSPALGFGEIITEIIKSKFIFV
jgi:hypothetical protein